MPPKKRHARARRDKRRAKNWQLTIALPGTCSQCGGPVRSHRVCPSCGFFGGQLIVPRRVKKKKEGAGAGAAQPEGGAQQA
jgi:large subunit ribosomal protein L32